MKRKAGLSMEEFKDYYENHHVPLCQKFSGGLDQYVRRYIYPQHHPVTGPCDDLGFDVITELCFESKKVFEGTLNYLTKATMPDEVIEDEMKFLDRTSFRIAYVEEHS